MYLQKENKKRKIQEEINLIFSQLNKRSSEDLLQIYRRIAQYKNGLYDFSNSFNDLTKEELLNNLNEFEKSKNKRIPPGNLLTLLDLSKHVSKGFLLDKHYQVLEEIAQSEKKRKEKEQRKLNKLNKKKF